MSFSIWVADDPELKTEEASNYPHFSATNAEMLALRAEMQAQNMFAFIQGSKFMFNDGEHVPAGEIANALGVARSEPMTAGAAEARELWRSWPGVPPGPRCNTRNAQSVNLCPGVASQITRMRHCSLTVRG